MPSPTKPTPQEKLALHYSHLATSLEKVKAIAIRRMPMTEDHLIEMVPEKYRNFAVIRHVWKELTQHRPKEDYSLSQLEKQQINFKHFRYHNNPKLDIHLPPIPNF